MSARPGGGAETWAAPHLYGWRCISTTLSHTQRISMRCDGAPMLALIQQRTLFRRAMITGDDVISDLRAEGLSPDVPVCACFAALSASDCYCRCWASASGGTVVVLPARSPAQPTASSASVPSMPPAMTWLRHTERMRLDRYSWLVVQTRM